MPEFQRRWGENKNNLPQPLKNHLTDLTVCEESAQEVVEAVPRIPRVPLGFKPHAPFLCAPLSNPSSCQTEHGLALTDGCQTLSNPGTAPPARDPFAETKCSCPQPIGAAGCGPKYPVCSVCGYTWRCKTCGGCRQCATPTPRGLTKGEASDIITAIKG